VRDAGALEAALYRPQTGYYPDLIGEAAALWESISQNHPFVDGNKRAAFALMFVFLRLNGCDLRVSDAEAQVFVLALYANGTFNFEQLRDWLAQTVVEPNR
jgi:death-on-curing protein